MPGSMRRFSGTLEHPPLRQNATDRRHSNASDTSMPDTNQVRQLSQENIPTRLTKVAAPKPAANPLQFIKVGPATLYKSAQEQLKKVEEIKKVKKEVRDEAEDWQSNLDNWKSSRRKRQEHIIERVVEVKKMEMEDYDRNRRRSKTFNEMMEERNSRGRKASLVLFKDDDANDLSDLGIGASSDKSSMSDDYGNDNHLDNRDRIDNENYNGKHGRNGHHDDDGSSVATISSPEPEEYTYERAIQGYVNYAETRVKSKTASTENNSREENETSKTEKLSNGHGKGLPPSPPHTPRRQSAAKIEEKLSALEKRRRSSTELNNGAKDLKMPLAKGEILKRRAMFELANDISEFTSKSTRRPSADSSNSKEKAGNKLNNANSKENSRIPSSEIPVVKEKSTEKVTESSKRKDAAESKQGLTNGEVSTAPTIQERLSNLGKQSSITERKDQISENCVTESIKDRLSNLDSACNKDTNRKVTPERDPSFQEKLANFQNTEEPEKIMNGIDRLNKLTNGPGADSERSSSPEEDVIYETKRQQFHRSLDSLDVEGSSDTGNEAFERVQSLEDLDCCSNTRNYPASASSTEMLVFSSQSGDTDREDSGIHTADVSCSVSQADEPVEDGEIIATINSVVPHLETSSSGADVYHLEVEIVNQKHQTQSPISVSSDVTSESKEMATAYLDVKGSSNDNLDSSTTPSTAESKNKNNTEINRMEQEKVLQSSRVATEEPKIHSEKCEIPNDTRVISAVIVEETVTSKDFAHNQELPYAEKNIQNVPKVVREEEKISPVIGIKKENQADDEVFLCTSKIPPLELSSDVEIVAGLAFPLGPPTSVEPPKEKPPPPPTELSDEEVPQKPSLKRLDSTKRIKKEIWRKRSDFLGIDGSNEDSYLEPELKVAPPPDMTTFLVEERRSEQQLYRQSICSETDSNHGETTESRDSGVELDRAHSDDWNGKLSSTPEVLSAQHSRQNSDIYGTASITSEEDEIMKKEREIIEILEKEEQWRYRNNTTAEENDIGEKLAVKLHQLEQEKMKLEWERTEEENKRQMKENARREEELRLRAKEQELRQQESLVASSMKRPTVTGKEERVVTASGEALQAERERLRRENEELKRQKETLQLLESQQLQHAHAQMQQQQQQQQWGSTNTLPHQQWSGEAVLPPTHLSLQDISMAPAGNVNSYHTSPSPIIQSPPPLNYRLSLPDLQQEEQIQNQQLPVRPASMMPTPRANPNRRPPPPIPPAKPLRIVSQEQRERENSIRNSRMPSADSIPQHVETTHGHHGSVPAYIGGQPISRQTLQALSAVPKSRFISNDMWMQPKKKPENQRSGGRDSTYNYQHWLIQEAEHRRITEQQQRNAGSPRKSAVPHPHPPHQSSWSVPQPQPQPQPRQDKPLPDAIIQTLTQRVQNRVGLHENKNISPSRRRLDDNACRESQPHVQNIGHVTNTNPNPTNNPALSSGDSQEKMLSVSGKKKCSHCGEELGRGAAMIIESLRLFYHIDCFKCCVCHVQLGDGLMGTDVRVRNNKLHCHNCYSSDDGVKFSCV